MVFKYIRNGTIFSVDVRESDQFHNRVGRPKLGYDRGVPIQHGDIFGREDHDHAFESCNLRHHRTVRYSETF